MTRRPHRIEEVADVGGEEEPCEGEGVVPAVMRLEKDKTVLFRRRHTRILTTGDVVGEGA